MWLAGTQTIDVVIQFHVYSRYSAGIDPKPEAGNQPVPAFRRHLGLTDTHGFGLMLVSIHLDLMIYWASLTIGSLWLSGRASERGWSEVRFLTETQNFSLSYARDKTINVFRYFFHLTYDIHVVIESVSRGRLVSIQSLLYRIYFSARCFLILKYFVKC